MKWLVANWKMNQPLLEAEKFFNELPRALLAAPDLSVGVAPMFPLIPSLAETAKSYGIRLGGQNAHWEDSGAFTGEIPAKLLAAMGCDFVIIGHSERRHIFGEPKDQVAKRAAKVMKTAMTAIFCVGEKIEEREAGKTEEVLSSQLAPLLEAWESDFTSKLTIAHEPVWAIGTGKTASSAQIKETHAFLRESLNKSTDSPDIPILYGGSVTPENAREILSLPNVGGALVGKASLSAKSFEALCRAAIAPEA